LTISISEEAFDDLYDETVEDCYQLDPDDELDMVQLTPMLVGHGYSRKIILREGLELHIDNSRWCNRLLIIRPERESWLDFHFHLCGQHKDKYTEVGDHQYVLYGSGIAPKDIIDSIHSDYVLEVTVSMQPEVLHSFIGNFQGQLPAQFSHLIRKPDQEHYTRCGSITPMIKRMLWQILRCPYQGVTKRMCLQGKILEIVALVLEQEAEIYKGQIQTISLEPERRDRIYHAREILLQNLDHPLSLGELARQAGLNECTLKREFRQVFGKTVFSYLRDYRLEQARQLLETEDISTTEVSRLVGFANRGYFAAAFREKFGLNPKEYKKQRKNSV
jgi:AraC-like DNA-binding protein